MYLPCGAPTCSNDTERLQSMVHEHYIQLTSVWATQHTIAFMQWRNTQVCWSRTRRDNEKRRCPHMAMSDLWTTKNLFLATLICCIPFIILRQPDKEWRKQISRCVKCCPAFHPFFIFDLFALSSTAFSFNCMPKKNTIYVEKQWTKKKQIRKSWNNWCEILKIGGYRLTLRHLWNNDYTSYTNIQRRSIMWVG